MTLAFLADVPERKLDDLEERLKRAAAAAYRVRHRPGRRWRVPERRPARVLWAGLDLDDAGRTELSRMATGARAAAATGRHRRRTGRGSSRT